MIIHNPNSHEDELAAIKPVYFTVSPMNPNARHALCDYERGGKRHIEMFLLNDQEDVRKQLELISAVAGGRMFKNLRFLIWYGEQGDDPKQLER